MFESLAIMPTKYLGAPAKVDLGFLAEALVFYDSVEVFANHIILRQLLSEWGPEQVLELIKQAKLNITYWQNGFGLVRLSDHFGRWEDSEVAGLMSVNHTSPDEVVFPLLEQMLGKSGKTRRLAISLTSKLNLYKYEMDFIYRAIEDLHDQEFVVSAVRTMLAADFPDYAPPDDLVYDIRSEGARLWVNTNLDLNELTRLYRLKTGKEHSGISGHHFVDKLFYVRDGLEISGEVISELAPDPTDSILMAKKVDDILNRRDSSSDNITHFQQVLLQGAYAIREAVNGGERGIKDIMQLLSKADRFRSWVAQQPNDAGLLDAYYREVTADESWVNKLPSKSTRFLFFTGVGMMLEPFIPPYGMLAGVALNAADQFLIDKLAAGWKPNQFVNGPLQLFVR